MQVVHNALILLSAALLPLACTQENGDPESSAEAPAGAPALGSWPQPLVRELLAMGQSNQRVRETVASLMRSNAPDSGALQRATAEQSTVDETNSRRLVEMVREHGWPAKSLVGAQAATAAFQIIQDGDYEVSFLKEYLAFLEREYPRGDAPGEAVAIVTDRTRLAQGMPQLYGTHVEIKDGQVVIHPIMNEDNVDQRRAMLGLVPMATYLASLKLTYGVPE